ncbi:unnamed protein product [Closterium sp. NIES-53]
MRFLATALTYPLFESTATSALVSELVEFAAACRLDFATSLVAESASSSIYPPSVGGECALGTAVLEDRQEEFECFAATVPHLVSMLLAPEGDPDAPDIPTPRSYAEAIEATYIDEVPPPGANIVSGMWIFRGVDFFQTFSPTPKMTTLWVLLHVAAQRDYELHSLDFSTAFLQGSLHEEIWLRRPPGFTGSFPAGTQWSLRRPVYGLREAPHEWLDTLRTILATLGFAPSTADPSLFLRTNTTLPPFYVLVYVDDLVFATADTEALAHVNSELQKRHTCTDLGELTSYLGLRITRDRAQRTITLTQSQMVQQFLQRFGFTYSLPQSTPLPTSHSLSAPPSDESVEPSGPYPELVGCLITLGMGLMLGERARVVLISHADASWVDDLATQRSSQGSSCESEIYAGAMAALELRRLTYMLTDLGEAPRSPPVLYVDNKAMLAFFQEHRLEHITKHIALRYFLARELQQRGQLRLAYVASQANTAYVFTKALQPCDHRPCFAFLDRSCANQQKSLSPQQLREWAVRWGSPGGGSGGTGSGGAVATGAGGSGGATIQPQQSALRHLLSLPPAATEFPVAGSTPLLLFPPSVQSQPQLLPGSPLPAPAPHTAVTESFTERREPASRPVTPVCSRHAVHPRPPPVPGTHIIVLRPSSVPQRVVLPSSPASSLPHVPDPRSDLVHTASRTAIRLLATVVTDPSFDSAVASALVAELVDFAALCRLDYAASLVFYSSCPPSVGGELALGCDILEDRQFELECLAGAAPHLASTLLCPEGDPDALDIPTLCTYAEAITGPYFSQWQTPMDAKMASWKSTGTYVDEIPPPGANIVDDMWIFRVKRPPGSPPAFKARYVARGFSQREGVDFFQTFSPTPKMTTLWVLLHVAAQRDYEPHSLDFRHPSCRAAFTRLSGCATHVASLGRFLWVPTGVFSDQSTAHFSAAVLVYVDDLVFATDDTKALALVKAELQERHICTDLGEMRSYLGLQITRDRARHTITLTQSHMVQQVLQRFDFSWSSPQPTPLSTGHSISAPPSDESVEPSGPYPELVGCLMYLMTCTRPDLAYPLSLLARYVAPGRHRKVHCEAAKRVLGYLCSTLGMGLVLGGPGPVVLTSHSDASWADDQTTHRSTYGYSFSLGTSSVSWRSTHSSYVLSSSCEAEIYAGAMAAQELRWLTYLQTDLCVPTLPHLFVS